MQKNLVPGVIDVPISHSTLFKALKKHHELSFKSLTIGVINHE
jgi:hypothetical protein